MNGFSAMKAVIRKAMITQVVCRVTFCHQQERKKVKRGRIYSGFNSA